jgi:hypothetical protein
VRKVIHLQYFLKVISEIIIKLLTTIINDERKTKFFIKFEDFSLSPVKGVKMIKNRH